jgi:hypothetical protein
LELDFVGVGFELLFPLKGGMGWINIGFAEVGGFVESVEVFGVLAAAFVGVGLADAGVAFREDSAAIFEADNCTLRGTAREAAAVFSDEVPMARASADAASLVDLSLICFCLTSSFARMVTRSSGIGLFNYSENIRDLGIILQ